MKKLLLLTGMCVMILAITQSAWAAGIGVYGTGGVAAMNWQSRDVKTGSSTDYFYGGGIVIDSVVAKNQLFGYRFTAGYEQYVFTDPGSDLKSDPIHRFSMTHTFGFGMLRTDMLRFWAGPRIGLHYLYKRESRYSLDGIGFDALLAFGLNINAGDIFTFFFDIGFGYMGIYNINANQQGHAMGIDGKVGFMFRISDNYLEKSSPGDIKIQVQDVKQNKKI